MAESEEEEFDLMTGSRSFVLELTPVAVGSEDINDGRLDDGKDSTGELEGNVDGSDMDDVAVVVVVADDEDDDEGEGEGEDSDGEDDTTAVLGGMMLGTMMAGKPAAAEIDAPPKVAVLVGRYSAKAGATAVEEPDVGEELRSGVASAVGEPVDGTPRGLALRRIVVSAEGDGGETNNDTGLPLASSARRMRSPITGHRIDSTARCAGTCLLSM